MVDGPKDAVVPLQLSPDVAALVAGDALGAVIEPNGQPVACRGFRGKNRSE